MMSLAVIDDKQQVLDLTELEIGTLAACEEVIERNLKAFMETGEALAIIRDQRLYRASHGTFEDYCLQKWGFSDRRARMLIDASEVVADLKSGTIVPLLPENEAQARPLAQIETAEERQEVWKEAVATAPDGRMTAAHVQTVVDRHTGKEAEREARAEAEKEAQAEALVSGFMDAPPAGGEMEQATPIDYPTSLALGRSLSLNVLKGEIGPPILLNGKLWVTERINGSLYECLCVTEMDGWIDRTQKKPVHYTERDASIEAGERDESEVTGLKVVWTSAPRDADCFYVLTGERRTFQFVARSQEGKAVSAPKPDRPEPEPVVQQKPEPEPSRTGPGEPDINPLPQTPEAVRQALARAGKILSDADASCSGCRLSFLEVQAMCVEVRRLQALEKAQKESGLLVTGKDYELLSALASRKRPGQDEEMTPADYLSLIIEQRAAAAGIVLDAGV